VNTTSRTPQNGGFALAHERVRVSMNSATSVTSRQAFAEEKRKMRDMEVHYYKLFKARFGYQTGQQCFMCAVGGYRNYCTSFKDCHSSNGTMCFRCLRTGDCPGANQCVVTNTKQQYKGRCYACLQSRRMHSEEGLMGSGCRKNGEDLLSRTAMYQLRNDPGKLREILKLMNYRGQRINPNNDGWKNLATFLDEGVDVSVYGEGGTNYMRFAAVWMALHMEGEQHTRAAGPNGHARCW